MHIATCCGLPLCLSSLGSPHTHTQRTPSRLSAQVPSTERSRAVTTVWGGLDVGSAVGLLLSGPLIRMYGWPSVFYLFAVLGGIWCLLWPFVRPSMQVSTAGLGVDLWCGQCDVADSWWWGVSARGQCDTAPLALTRLGCFLLPTAYNFL